MPLDSQLLIPLNTRHERVNTSKEVDALVADYPKQLQQRAELNTIAALLADDKATISAKAEEIKKAEEQKLVFEAKLDVAALPLAAKKVYNAQALEQGSAQRAADLCAAAKFYYWQEAKSDAKNKFDEKINAFFQGWQGQANHTLTTLMDGLQEIINAEDQQGLGARQNQPPRLLELDALRRQFIDKDNPNPLVTVTELKSPAGKTIRVIQKTTPLFNLTDEQIQELLQLSIQRRPIWFLKLSVWQQVFITESIAKLRVQAAVNGQEDPRVLAAKIREYFGHPTANMRQLPLLANHYKTEIIVVEQKQQDKWDIVYQYETERSAGPFADLAFITEEAEQLRLSQLQINQVLRAQIEAKVQQFQQKWGQCKFKNDDGEVEVLKIPLVFAWHTLFSPTFADNNANKYWGQNNNTTMLKLVRNALLELGEEFADELWVNGIPCDFTMMVLNSPIQHQNMVSEDGYTKHDVVELVNAVIEYLKTIIHSNKFPHQEVQLAEGEDLQTKLEGFIAFLEHFSSAAGLREIEFRADQIAFAKGIPDRNLNLLINAFMEFIRTMNAAEANPHLNKELHLAALKEIMLQEIGAVKSICCKNGDNRVAAVEENVAAMIAYWELTGEILNYQSNALAIFAPLYKDIVDRAHGARVRAHNYPGSEAVKGLLENVHPCYARTLTNEEKAAQAKLAELSKPKDDLGSNYQIETPPRLVDTSKASIKELQKQRRNKKGVKDVFRAFIYTLDQGWLSKSIAAQNVDLELYGLTPTFSREYFLRWLKMPSYFWDFLAKGLTKKLAVFDDTELAAYTHRLDALRLTVDHAQQYRRELFLFPQTVDLVLAIDEHAEAKPAAQQAAVGQAENLEAEEKRRSKALCNFEWPLTQSMQIQLLLLRDFLKKEWMQEELLHRSGAPVKNPRCCSDVRMFSRRRSFNAHMKSIMQKLQETIENACGDGFENSLHRDDYQFEAFKKLIAGKMDTEQLVQQYLEVCVRFAVGAEEELKNEVTLYGDTMVGKILEFTTPVPCCSCKTVTNFIGDYKLQLLALAFFAADMGYWQYENKHVPVDEQKQWNFKLFALFLGWVALGAYTVFTGVYKLIQGCYQEREAQRYIRDHEHASLFMADVTDIGDVAPGDRAVFQPQGPAQ